MWSSVQCGPDPFKASLQAVHQQQALAEQTRSHTSAVGPHALPLSTASSRPLLHPHQSLRPQSSQQRTPLPPWADEYLHTQQPPSATAFHPLPLRSAAASSWLTDYSNFHARAPVPAGGSVGPLSVDEYSRALAQHASRAQHFASAPSTTNLSSPTHLPQPQLSALSPSSVLHITATLTAFHQPFTAATVPFLSHFPQPAAHHTLPSTSGLPATAATAATIATPPLSTASDTAAPSTHAHSKHAPSTAATADAAYGAIEAARLHDALYGDEHELSDTDFIHNGQWQHYTPQHSDPLPLTTVGLSTHILQHMYDTAQPPPQQRYTAAERVEGRGSEVRQKEVGGVGVGVLEFGSEWDASGRVWDWVVRERQMEEAAEGGQEAEGALYGQAAAVSAAAAGAMMTADGVGEMDVMLKEYYL